MKDIVITLFLLLNLPYCSLSQNLLPEDTTDVTNDELIERLLQDTDTDAEDSDVIDHIDDLRRNPVDLNTANAEELTAIPLITHELALKILRYRHDHLRFGSKRELLNIEGFSASLYELVKPYLTARKPAKPKDLTSRSERTRNSFNAYFRSFAVQELQTRKGYISGKYPGPKFRLSNRMLADFSVNDYKLSGGIATDKDAGELSAFDFVSGFLSYESTGLLSKIIAGDYQLALGRGLLVSNSYSVPKSVETFIRAGKPSRIAGYASAGEYSYFRGMAAHLKFNPFSAIAFASYKSIDASIDSATGEVRSVYQDGYHRTVSETGRKDKLKELLLGLRAEYVNGPLISGVTLYSAAYSPGIIADTVKKLYDVSGKRIRFAGGDFSYSFSSGMQLFGDAAIGESGMPAMHFGLSSAMGSFARAVFSYRNYPYNFRSPYGSPPGERSEAGNESGFYAGIRITPWKGAAFSAYFDRYSFPYRTYFTSVPTRGREILVSGEYNAGKGLFLILRFRNEHKDDQFITTDAGGRQRTVIAERRQSNLRAGLKLKNNSVTITGRYEYCFVSLGGIAPSQKGHLLFAEMTPRLFDKAFFSVRAIAFRTDGYDSRISEYEGEISGVMTNQFLYGNGFRWYVLLKADLPLNIRLEAKYSETFWNSVKKIGNGNDEIAGDTLGRLGISIQVRF